MIRVEFASSGSITPLPLDPELFGELLEKVPAEVIEQLTDNWRKQTEALARSQKENRLLRELLRLMRVEKYGPASERLSDEQLELLEQEPGVIQAEVQVSRCTKLGDWRALSFEGVSSFSTIFNCT